MFKRLVSVWLCILLCMTGLGALCVFDVPINIIDIAAAGNTLYVNKTGSGGAYTSIQAAIDDSLDGDTVFIYSGTYDESVMVNVRINLTGEDRESTIINGSGSGEVVYIGVNGVNITGLTITLGDTGIRLFHSSYCVLHNNNIAFNLWDGIILDSSSHNNITDNDIYSNTFNGFVLDSNSNNNTLIGNNISYNDESGIDIRLSTKNNIFGNDIVSNGLRGISLDPLSSDSIIQGNFISLNNEGIIIT
ncbi:MAG: right-handed parallel beta-helix repeat-containing protein, partial [Thermoplasmata archaeon]